MPASVDEIAPRHRVTVQECHRMAAAGILGAQDRVELIEGEIIDIPMPAEPSREHVATRCSGGAEGDLVCHTEIRYGGYYGIDPGGRSVARQGAGTRSGVWRRE